MCTNVIPFPKQTNPKIFSPESSEIREMTTMAMEEESKKSPDVKKSENANPLFSPGFRSVAEMAGWDEEALLIASLVVEETPDRNPKQRRRSVLARNSGTPPPGNSRRKRAKAQTSSPMPVTVLNLEEAGCQKEAVDLELSGGNNEIGEPSKEKKSSDLPSSSSSSSSGICSAEPPPAIPCIEKLRDELSCAICLEICFEPSTTPCGHSFCKKCLRSAADKCGKKCPKCRQLISNTRSSTVNTVLWNTIQLLFPEEVEARKKAATIPKDAQEQNPAEKNHHQQQQQHRISRNRRVPVLINTPERMNPRVGGAQRRNFGLNGMVSSSRGSDFISVARPRRGQVEDDAALALRLQREEFVGMGSNDGDQQQQHRRRNSLAFARANLRAMASRAINIRRRT